MLKRQFMLDWERIVSKSRFRRLVGREDAGVRKEGQGLEEELDEVREELYAKRDILRMAFIYYSMMSGYARKDVVCCLAFCTLPSLFPKSDRFLYSTFLHVNDPFLHTLMHTFVCCFSAGVGGIDSFDSNILILYELFCEHKKKAKSDRK